VLVLVVVVVVTSESPITAPHCPFIPLSQTTSDSSRFQRSDRRTVTLRTSHGASEGRDPRVEGSGRGGVLHGRGVDYGHDVSVARALAMARALSMAWTLAMAMAMAMALADGSG
jgi:hypothetical protein